MLIYILKFSACLAVFMVFYKLFLEKENMHLFKRFYLIFVIIIALGIPFITFTEYIVASSDTQPVIINDLVINTNTNSDYLSTILWSIYGLGAIVFGILFLKNLIQILFKINRNTKVKSRNYTNVLLRNLVIPHTFFNYIFLNKHKFETKQIPKEVLLHEETHASQKHSLDILFIEILQVIFWFNPLLYFIKKDIKLNHEFLADQAVLSKGVVPSVYQQTLLAFSSNAQEPQLANAINYSLIKKRFTVMKTQTSKKGIWLRSLILLPILAVLLFSFSTKVIVLEEKTNKTEQELISVQEKATKKQIAEYNALAKKYNDMTEDNMIIRKKDLERLKKLYHLMSEEQKKNAQPFPNIPPPPKVVEIVEVSTPEVIKVVEIPPAAIASKVIEVIEIPPNAHKAPKVLEVKEIPPSAPLPTNATPAQKKKHEEAVKNYKLKTQKVELRKIKERELIKVRELRAEDRKQLQEVKLAYRNALFTAKEEKIKAEKGELVRVRELRSVENRKNLQTEKRAYKEAQVAAKVLKLKAQKGELVRIRELRSVEDRKKMQTEKRAYKEAQVAAKVLKLKAQKRELVKLREVRSVENRKKLQAEKRTYKEAQVAAKVLKLKAQKGELVKLREVRSVENRKKLQAEKRTYKEAQVAAKVLKLKAQKGELVKIREVRIAQDKERVREAKKVYIKAKAEKEELIRIWEKEAKEQKELKNKIYKQLKSKVKDQKIYTEEEINKMAKAEKKAYKKAQRKEKAQKKKSDKNENE